MFQSKLKDLNALLRRYTELKNRFKALRECFSDAIFFETKSLRLRLSKLLEDKGKILINSLESSGLFYLLNYIEKEKNNSLYVNLSEAVYNANQLASIILREFMQIPTKDPLRKLKEFDTERAGIFLIIEGISRLDEKEIALFLSALPEAEVILIDSRLRRLDGIENTLFFNLQFERYLEIGANMLGYSRGSDISYRQDFQDLFKFFGNIPEILPLVFMFFILHKYDFVRLSKDVKKFCDKNKKALDELDVSDKFLHFVFSKLPIEILEVAKALYLVGQGDFFLYEDLKILFKDRPFISRRLESIFNFLQDLLQIRKTERDFSVYRLPEFIKTFLKTRFAKNITKNDDIRFRRFLSKRLENYGLWQSKTVWMSQFKYTLEYLKRNLEMGTTGRISIYNLLYFHTVLLELGFVDEVKNYVVPACQREIQFSESNKSRGSWYNLLGTIYKGISEYVNRQLNLENALEAFQKSLKFYNPQNERKTYAFVFEQIGRIYISLSEYEVEDKKADCLKNASRALSKSLSLQNKMSSSYINLSFMLAQVHVDLAQLGRPLENYQKSFLLYEELFLAFDSRLEGEDKKRLLENKLINLNERLNKMIEKDSSMREKGDLMSLKRELVKLIPERRNVL